MLATSTAPAIQRTKTSLATVAILFHEVHQLTIISQIKVYVVGFDRFWSLLLVAENKVNPIWEHLRTNVTLKRSPHNLDELFRTPFSPWGQSNVAQDFAILRCT